MKKIPIKIRLKGDRQIHWNDKRKSSYKIKIRGKNRFNGLKEFSIQKPRARNYIYEWIFHESNSETEDAIGSNNKHSSSKKSTNIGDDFQVNYKHNLIHIVY